MYNRTYNFSAGPATMPVPVLEEIRDELLNYRGAGMGVMEMSHRSKVFQTIIDEAEQDLRDLMGIPDNYKVLFIQGGATLQFAMIPMNLMKNGKAIYIETGAWSKKAIAEAKKYGEVNVAASSKDRQLCLHSRLLQSAGRRGYGLCLYLRERDYPRHDVAEAAGARRASPWSLTSPLCSCPSRAMFRTTA